MARPLTGYNSPLLNGTAIKRRTFFCGFPIKMLFKNNYSRIPKVEPEDSLSPLSLETYYLPLCILGVGLMAATLALFAEIIICKTKKA